MPFVFLAVAAATPLAAQSSEDAWMAAFGSSVSARLSGLSSDREAFDDLLATYPELADLPVADREAAFAMFSRMRQGEVVRGWFDALERCDADRARFCGEPDGDVSCLARNVAELDRCCAAGLRAAFPDDGFGEPREHHGVVLPAGSSVRFSSDCLESGVSLHEPITLAGADIGPGDLTFDDNGRPVSLYASGDFVARGIGFKAEREWVPIYPDGTPHEGVLLDNTRIDGRVWAGGTRIAFGPDGSIRDGLLGATHAVGGIAVPAGARFTGASAGELAGYHYVTDEPVELATVAVPPGSPIRLAADGQPLSVVLSTLVVRDDRLHPQGSELRFDDAGRVVFDGARALHARRNAENPGSFRELAQPERFDGIVLPTGSIVERIRSGGSWIRVLVAQPVRFGDVSFGPGVLDFDDNLRLTRGELTPRQRVGALLLGRGDSRWRVGDNGYRAHLRYDGLRAESSMSSVRDSRLHDVLLDADAQQGGVRFAAGSRVQLFDNRRIEEGTSSVPSRVGRLEVPAATPVRFRETGSLAWLDAERPVAFGTARFDGRSMRMHASGHPEDAVLLEAAAFGGLVYRAGTHLGFDAIGKVVDSKAGEKRWPDGWTPSASPPGALLMRVPLIRFFTKRRECKPDEPREPTTGFSANPFQHRCFGWGDDGVMRYPR